MTPPAVRDLDKPIMASGPDLHSRISYRMLMYTLGELVFQLGLANGSTAKLGSLLVESSATSKRSS
jgi:hypothetical protein